MYAYADNLAIVQADGNSAEEDLHLHVTIRVVHLHARNLKLNTTKRLLFIFNLHHKEAKPELEAQYDGKHSRLSQIQNTSV